MRILLCERALSGHRRTYVSRLLQTPDVECFCFIPENVGVDEAHYFECQWNGDDKSLGDYLSWICQIRQIVRREKIDIVHFLDGDSIMRWFGAGFSSLGTPRIVLTYHRFYSGLLRKLSYHCMCAGKDRCCVVHTPEIFDNLTKVGLKSVHLCTYPAFPYVSLGQRSTAQAKQALSVPQDVPSIGIVGGMSKYKNILPFLDALRDCREPFRLILCGKPADISAEELERAIAPYRDRVTVLLRQLSGEEYETAIAASDIIFCVYDGSFDGASGPLTDGVCARKMILSCQHGALGETVARNHLGLCARWNDREQIIDKTGEALRTVRQFRYDDTAQAFRQTLDPGQFQLAYQRIYLQGRESE